MRPRQMRCKAIIDYEHPEVLLNNKDKTIYLNDDKELYHDHYHNHTDDHYHIVHDLIDNNHVNNDY